MTTPAASVSAKCPADAIPALPDANASAADFKPDGVVIHLQPVARRPRISVQVRVGDGEDCPVVRPPASVWFDSRGRLLAVATPKTDSDVEEEEEKKQNAMDTGSKLSHVGNNPSGVSGNNDNKPKQPEVIVIDDDDDDDVVCLN